VFYDIDTQKKALEIPANETRVLPYAESIAWVSENMLVAVSHLKAGCTWESAKTFIENGMKDPVAEPNQSSLPETQTNMIYLYYTPGDSRLKYSVLVIKALPHQKPIGTISAVTGEYDRSVSYVTGGNDKRLVCGIFLVCRTSMLYCHFLLAKC